MYQEFLAPFARRCNQLKEQLETSVSDKEREALKAKLAELEKERDDAEKYLVGFARRLQEFEDKMLPGNLHERLFPKSMRVKEFQSGRLLRVEVLSSRHEKISRGTTAVLYALVITAVFGMFIPVPIWISAPLIAYCAYKMYGMNTMTFNLIRRQVSYVTAASPTLRGIPMKVEVVSEAVGDKWKAHMLVLSHKIAESGLFDSETDARAELLPFAHAMNWRIGYPLFIGGWWKESPHKRENMIQKLMDTLDK